MNSKRNSTNMMKRLMKFSTRRAIVLMLIIPTIGFIFILSTFYLYINKTKDDVLFTNIAGRQRMLSEQLSAYAHMVYNMGQEEDREPLRELVANFDNSLAVLDQGSEIMGRRLSPPPAEIQDEIDAVKQLWQDLKPALLLVADQPTTSTQAVKAYNFIKVNIPRLRDLSNEVVFSFELLSHNQKERILWVLITVLSLNFVLLFTGIVVTKRYLTERKQAEKTLRKSEKKYSTLFELAGDAFLTVLPPDGKSIDANEAAIRMLGYSKEELRKLSGRDIISPKVFEETEREWQRQVEENGYFLLETIWVHKDGSRFPVEVSGKPFELGGQALFQLIGRDITKRKQAEEALRRTQQNFKALVNSIEGIVWEADALTFQFSFISKQAERLLGYPTERWLSEPEFWKNHIHPDDRSWAIAYCKNAIEKKQAHEFEYRMIDADGRTVWLRDIVSVVVENDQPVKLRGIMVDITERKQAEEKVEKLSEAVEQSPDMVFITNPNGKIEYINSAFTEITGYIAEDAFGETPTILNSGEMSKEYFQQLWSTISSGKTFRSEVINRKKNGEFFIYDQTITPLKDTDGNIINFISTGKDITEQVEAKKKLEEALAHAEQSDKVKSLFLANMSHEIRTPLNSILGFTDLIEESVKHKIEPEEQTFFNSVRSSGKRLMNTVHEILDMSQIEVGTLAVDIKELDLVKVAKETTALLIPQAESKGLKLSFTSDLSNAIIKGDQYCLVQALTNIIENAIKYTNEGRIDISLNEKDSQLILSIKDTGIGISLEYLDEIFDVFTQESTGYTKKFQGVGLGLALAERYLEFCDATINAESEKDVGSTFVLTFQKVKKAPSKKVKKPKVEIQKAPTPEAEKKPLVLVVEDDLNSQKLISFYLKQQYDTSFAVSVEEAKEKLKSESVAVILLDLSLIGEEDGLDLTRYLRKTKKWKELPIIATTAHAFETDKENCLKAGCNDYMAKPLKRKDLLDKISQFA